MTTHIPSSDDFNNTSIPLINPHGADRDNFTSCYGFPLRPKYLPSSAPQYRKSSAYVSSGEVQVASRGQDIVSVAFRVVNPKHDEFRPAVSKELYQLHRKIRVYKLHSLIVLYFVHNYMHTCRIVE